MRKNLFRSLAVAIAFSCSHFAFSQELVVSAAASLSNAFTEIGAEFEKQNPDVKITFNFAASGVLLRQIEQGAPVDVFASADQPTMDRAELAGLVINNTRVDFVENKLVLIVPKGVASPLSLADLTNNIYRNIAVGTPSSVPAGNYTQQSLEKENLWKVLEPKFVYGESVRQVLQYVTTKEADAGFVYSTDAAVNAKEVDIALVIPTLNPITYPMVQVEASDNKELAQKFMQFIMGDYAQKVLASYGFASPSK